MKTKFERMSKEEKKAAIKEFEESADNRKEIIKRVKRVSILSIIGILYTLSLLIYNIVVDKPIYEIVFAGALLIGCIILLRVARNLLYTQVNNYVISKLRGKERADYKKGLDVPEKKKKKKN